MNQKLETACFTGHRELQMPADILSETVRAVVEQSIHEGYRFFGAGGARGFDALASRTVLRLKEKYPQIHLILVLPFQNQYEHEYGWRDDEIQEYHYLKENASKVICLQKQYSNGCYYRRNQHLVDFSSLCICYQYKSWGGTAYTTQYAKEKNLRILNCC